MARPHHPQNPLDETSPGVIASSVQVLPLRVVVVGALEWARRDLAQVLRADGGDIDVLDGGDAASLRLPSTMDVVLLDARVSPEDALLVLERMRKRDWAVKCVVIAAEQDEDVILEALRLGATDIVHPPLASAGLAALLARLGG